MIIEKKKSQLTANDSHSKASTLREKCISQRETFAKDIVCALANIRRSFYLLKNPFFRDTTWLYSLIKANNVRFKLRSENRLKFELNSLRNDSIGFRKITIDQFVVTYSSGSSRVRPSWVLGSWTHSWEQVQRVWEREQICHCYVSRTSWALRRPHGVGDLWP